MADPAPQDSRSPLQKLADWLVQVGESAASALLGEEVKVKVVIATETEQAEASSEDEVEEPDVGDEPQPGDERGSGPNDPDDSTP